MGTNGNGLFLRHGRGFGSKRRFFQRGWAGEAAAGRWIPGWGEAEQQKHVTGGSALGSPLKGTHVPSVPLERAPMSPPQGTRVTSVLLERDPVSPLLPPKGPRVPSVPLLKGPHVPSVAPKGTPCPLSLPVCPDLVDKYLEETSIRYVTPRAHGETEHGLGHPHKSVPPHHPVVCCSPAGPQICTKRPGRGRTLLSSQRKRRKSATPDPKEKQTCDIRLRVRAEYCQHETALQGNVFSNKQDPLERQFERFNQANTILKSRDLGSIICDIKFSELTYLDAFWRDYINGSLLEALKGVFITDSLKQAVGHEAIKLLVNVDEEDYEVGRQKLLRNLMLQTAP
uniref:Death effector domain containing n=1 Tax=Calidris pygmaea TaxID=425635 RepID=A0A8C3PHU8_9CHAR